MSVDLQTCGCGTRYRWLRNTDTKVPAPIEELAHPEGTIEPDLTRGMYTTIVPTLRAQYAGQLHRIHFMYCDQRPDRSTRAAAIEAMTLPEHKR